MIYKKTRIKQNIMKSKVFENRVLDLFLDLNLASLHELDLSNILLDSRCLE